MLKNGYKKAVLNPDKPIELKSAADKLSFGRIIDSIVDLIKLPQTPFTFGLFGRWGTGKSTILGEIEKRLDGKDHYVVTFDAWKYEGDALRRSFLMSIARQLNEKKKSKNPLHKAKALSDKFVAELEDNMYKDRSEPELKANISLLKIVVYIAVFLILLVAQIAIVLSDPEAELMKDIARFSPLVLAFIMGIATFIVSVVSPSSVGKLFVKEINIGTEKLSSPEEFHSKFLSILEKIKGKTLLVVIDNLDRTQKDVTVKLLGTIKTFLNADKGTEDVIFLVATDHRAIKRHIKDVYANNPDDAYEAEEFIKKFFNTVIEIPPFISSEYRDYLIDLVESTGIEMLSERKEDIISIISAGYPENPRGAKHFVNSLVVYLLMLSSIGAEAGVEQDFIEKNLSFIATMLVIRDRFDEVYDDIQEHSLKYEHAWDEIKERMSSAYNGDDAVLAKRKDFHIFYDSIESWVAPSGGSLKWFFNMRRSSEEQRLANWDAFVSSVDKKDQDQAIKYLGEFYEQPDVLNTLLEGHIRNIKGEVSRWTSFCAVYMGYLTRTNPDAVSGLKGATNQVFRYFPNTNEFYKFANQISIKKLLDIMGSDFIGSTQKQRVRQAINEHIKAKHISDDGLVEVVQAELASASVNASTLKAIGAYVDDSNGFTDSIDVMRELIALNEKQKFITSQAALKVVEAIANKDLENREVLDVKLSFLEASGTIEAQAANKYVDLMNWLQGRHDHESRSMVALYLYKFLALAKDKPDMFSSQVIQMMTQYVINWYQQNRNGHKENAKLVVLLTQLAKYDANGYAHNARDIIQEFFDSADKEALLFVLDQIEPDEKNKQLISSKLNVRILKDVTLFDDIIQRTADWFSKDELANLATYLVANAGSVNTEQRFIEFIELSRRALRDSGHEDVSAYESKVYEVLASSIPKFNNAVSSYAYKRKDNILATNPGQLLDLKRRLKDAKEQDSEEAS